MRARWAGSCDGGEGGRDAIANFQVHARRGSKEKHGVRGQCGVLDVSHPDQSTLFAVAAVAGLVGGLSLVGWRGASASAALSNVKVAVAKKSYGRVPTLVSIIGDFFKVSVATGTYDTR